MKRETLAAIDIGSNAIRLLINYTEKNSKANFKKAAFVRVPIRLGEDVFTVGEISEKKREKLCSAMSAFSMLMKTFNVKRYRACATSAMREASNGEDVVNHIRCISGINIEIISGKEEAETIFEAGDTQGFLQNDATYLFVDVGGGSTEVTIYSNRKRIVSESFKLGTVRAISNGIDKKDQKKFKEWLESVAYYYKPTAIVGSGGNINKVHRLLGKDDKEPILYNEIKELYENMNGMTYEERVASMGLNLYRADVIVPAMKIFITAAKSCKINDIIVPKIGLADGVIHNLYYSPDQSGNIFSK